jgi:hypothetical protein
MFCINMNVRTEEHISKFFESSYDGKYSFSYLV